MYDYKTAVGIAKFLVVCGWILTVISIIITLVIFVNIMNGLAFFIPMAIVGIVSGVFLIIVGQISWAVMDAVMDNANYSKEMLDVMKNGYSINTSTETNKSSNTRSRMDYSDEPYPFMFVYKNTKVSHDNKTFLVNGKEFKSSEEAKAFIDS